MAARLPKWDAITDQIVIGSFPINASAVEHIAKTSECTAILSLQSDEDLDHYKIDWFDLERRGEESDLVMKRIPMQDFDLDNQRRVLGEAVHCLASLLKNDHRVYVHCTAGMNRSPLVVLGYLTFCEGMSLEDAGLLLVTQRPSAAPPIEVWRSVRLDLLKPHSEALSSLRDELAQQGPLDGGREAEAERRVLRGIFLPTASKS